MGRRTYYKTQYNRPNRNWVCGRARDGMPCPKGPGTSGGCPGKYECTPVKIGGRWQCTRPDPYGGPCDSPGLPDPGFGPMSSASGDSAVCCRPAGCVPERSIRAKRKLTVSAAIGLCVGVLMVGIGSPKIRDQFITPGLLTVHHQGASVGAGRIAGTSELNCAQCHHAVDETAGESSLVAAIEPFSWVGAAFSGPPEATEAARLAQNSLCLDCHSEGWVSSPHTPHGLERDVLEAYTERTNGSDAVKRGGPLLRLAKLTGGPPMSDQDQLACATCHREHQGRLHDLKVLNDRQCQVCHIQQFASFNAGHPDFPNRDEGDDYTYPYRRRERLIYDHVFHEKQQYTEAKLTADGSVVTDETTGETVRIRKELPGVPPGGQAGCYTCHELDHSERTMQIKSFETMCGECHFEKDILGSKPLRVWGYAGLTPGVKFAVSDLEFLFEDEIDAAEEADQPAIEALLDDFLDVKDRADYLPVANQSEVSALMLPLLRQYYEGSDAEFVADARLVLEGMRGDLKNIQDTVLADISPQLQAVERFARAGQRVESALVEPVSEDGGSPGLTPWGDALSLSMSSKGAAFGAFGARPSWGAEDLDMLGGDTLIASGGWEVVAEEPETPWAETVAELAPLGELLAAQPAAGEAAEGEETPAAQPIPEIAAMAAWMQNRAAFSEWLFGSIQFVEKAWRLREDEDAPVTAENWIPLVNGVDAFAKLKARTAEEGLDEDTAAAIAEFVAWFEDPELVRRALGEMSTAPWYGLHAPRNVFYHVTRHADPLLTTWLDAAGRAYGRNDESGVMSRLLFDHLAGKDSPKTNSAGSCLKCHSVDLKDMGETIEVQVNWSGERERRQFTSFNHAPHMKLKGMQCSDCHAMVAEEDPAFPFAESYVARTTDGETSTALGTDPTQFRSNFVGIDKQYCMQCHTAQDAGNTCLVCHKYHVEDVYRRGVGRSLDSLWQNLSRAPVSAEALEEAADAVAETL